MRMDICLRWNPQAIAAAAIYLAAKDLCLSLPEGDEPWWVVFDADKVTILAIEDRLMGLYALPQVPTHIHTHTHTHIH
jgi:hypothetical protein